MKQNKTKLRDLISAHNGKVIDKWFGYFSIYDGLFVDFRSRKINFFEIGIQNGGSLEVWARYFEHANSLVGCDINPNCLKLKFEDKRIKTIVGDVNNEDTLSRVLGQLSGLDIIIDDGSHLASDIIRSFCIYFPKLNESGIYVIEDLHCDYWSEYSGGLFKPDSAISFFKKIVDVINYEHWGFGIKSHEILESFFLKYDCHLDDSVLKTIHSIQFYNSICVIKKRMPEDNKLMKRVVFGDDAIVEQRVLEFSGEYIGPDQQLGNVWLRPSSMQDKLKKIETILLEKEAELDKIHKSFLYKAIKRLSRISSLFFRS